MKYVLALLPRDPVTSTLNAPSLSHGVGKLVLCGRVSQRMHECLI